MRPFTDDLDLIDVFGSGLFNGPRHRRPNEDYDDLEDYEDYEDYEDSEDYGDYNEDEFDSYARDHHSY